MATYIPGSKSYMPEFKPFTPDYKFLSAVLDTKTTRYNTNYKHLNNLYSKIVYAPLSRKDTQEMREQFTQGLSDKLEKISGMDLSLVQNVDAAKSVFKPFFETDIIVKDMVMTKVYEQEKSHANRLLNDPDQKRRDMYWDTGIKAMDYKMKDFIEADPDKALTAQLPRYVPDADLYQMSLELLKESGIEVEKDFITPGGQWVVRKKNGDLVTQQALELVQRSLMDDPRVQQAYYTKSYVEQRDFAEEGIQSGKFQSKEAAEQAWAQQQISQYTALINEKQKKVEKEVKEYTLSQQGWEEFREKYGIVPGSEHEKEMRRIHEARLAKIEEMNTINQAQREANRQVNTQSTADLLNKAYNLSMQYNMKNDMIAAAIAYGKQNESYKIMMENPEFKRNREFQYAKNLDDYRTLNEIKIAREKNRLARNLEKYKKELDLAYAPKETESLLNSDPIYGSPGTTTKINEDIITYNNSLIEKKFINDVRPAGKDYILRALRIGAVKNDFLNSSVYKSLGLDGIGSINNVNEKSLYNLLDNIDESQLHKIVTTVENIVGRYTNKTAPNGKPNNSYNINIASSSAFTELHKSKKNYTDHYTHYWEGQSRLFDAYSKGVVNAIKINGENEFPTGYNRTTLNSFFELNGIELTPNNLRRGLRLVVDKNGDTDGRLRFLDPGGQILPKQQFINEYLELAEAGVLNIYVRPNLSAGLQGTIDGTGNKIHNYRSIHTKLPSHPQAGEDEKGLFQAAQAIKDAGFLYDQLYAALVQSQTELPASDQGDKGTGETFPIFDLNSFYIGQKGRPQNEENTGFLNPSYNVSITPRSLSQEAQFTISTLWNQLQTTPKANMTVQPGILGTKKSKEFLKAYDETALTLLKNYLVDVDSNYKSGSGKTPTDTEPNGEIIYNPVYGGTDDLDQTRAAYIVRMNRDWIKKQIPSATEDQIKSYEYITFAFDQSNDMNPRKSGAVNYSRVMRDIIYANDNSYSYDVPEGGSVRITQDLSNPNLFYSHITQLSYDPQTGNFNANEIERSYDFTGQDYISGVDMLAQEIERLLYSNRDANMREMLNNINAVK